MPDSREFGNINARLDIAEQEIEKLRILRHKNAQQPTVISNLLGAMKILNKRLAAVEKTQAGQARLVGVVSGISAILGGALAFAADKLWGK